MKRLMFTLSLFVMAMTVMAIPAKKGLWQTLRLADGTEVKAQLMGDEHLNYWQTEKGDRYVVEDNGTAVPADMEQMTRRASMRRAQLSARMRSPKRVVTGEQTHYTGQKKGIVILMQFTDTKFKTANNQAKYNDILNKENYKTSPFKGSVADYFKAQSGGIFELTFDVVGPYTAKNNYSYYGKDYGGEGNDQHADELIVEAVKAANAEVDFKDYDWDGDGEVDQVFVLYAGTGQADGGASNTIWPHMYFLSISNMQQTLDGVRINTYACSNEVMPNGTIEGIGCFCHEFSHCLGYPDFYDTSYSGWYGTGDYDLMCGGSYNGNSYQPAGYTAYEKWMAGWLEPIVLDKDGVTVENLQPLSNGGDAYIIYNDGNKNEYYMLENRQLVGWDASLPGKGLMITHVDFDSQIWQDNTPNTKITSSDLYTYGYSKTNDHQRCAIICADNSASDYTAANDLFPYGSKNSLTDTSTPKASLYNKNTDGTKLLHKPVTEIKQNSDKTMSFLYKGGKAEPVDTTVVVPVDTTVVEPVDTIPVIVIKGDTLFYESFNNCKGSGGNDGKWSGQIASSTINLDNADWTYEAGYAADSCARFGNGSKNGKVTTPVFAIDGEAILTFKAATWIGDGEALEVTASNGVSVSVSQLSLPEGEWGEFTITLTGSGNTQLTFTPVKRFFLDEVLVMKPKDKEPPIDYEACDLNGDGKVDAADIIFLIKAIAKKQTETVTQ